MMKLIKYLKPYRIPVIFVLILVFFQALSELYLPTLMSDIVNKGVVQGDTQYIWEIGGYMLIVAFLGMACSIGASYFSSVAASGYGKLLRGKVFGHVSNFSLEEFDKVGTASLITRTTNDINQLQQVLIMVLRMMVMAPMMAIGGIIMAVSKDATLSLIFIVVIPLLALAIFLIARKGVPLFRSIQLKIDKLNLVLRENLTGIRVIRSFNRVEHESKRFDKASLDLMDVSIKVNKIMALMMPVMMLVMNISAVSIIWFGGIRIDAGHMQVGDLMAFIQYAMQIMFSLVMVSMMFVLIPRAAASGARVNEVLNMEPVIKNPSSTASKTSKTGFVEFQNVTFSYPGAENPAISDVSFEARPGQVTAIIGGTGSGKSTLVSLIPRFYDVTQGKILVNGADVRTMSQEELRKKIGYVPQKAVLFTGTINDNVRYGKEDATEEEIKHAANIAQANNFISEMEQGYESLISQGGTNVSGGQKQRLSIARALVRKAEIYVFDDSFSALDFKTDAKLRAALKDETEESTVIIVAQRVSTVLDADQIIVLDESKVAGIGTHQELMESCEVYQEIVRSQLSEEEIA